MWWRRSWFSLKGKAGIPAQTEGCPATSIGPRVLPVGSLQQRVQHPTYKALAELGKAVKTTFLCRYVHDQALRREINDGLNVVEHWNSANDFIFFARRGEFSSNRREDQELSMLSSWSCCRTAWST